VSLNVSGIYQIRNITNDKIYIGSAVNIKNRWKTHKSDLNLNKHHSPYLQRAWDKHGVENFEFGVLELVDSKENLLTREQFWMDKTNCYDPKIGYNLSKYAGSRLGVKATEETKKKMSIINKGNKYSLGHKHTEETKQKMKANKAYTQTEEFSEMRKKHTQGENNPTARLTESKVLEIRRLVKEGNLRDVDIASMFGITRHMVYSIKTYRTWKHVS
jgi:group I intron endonuclease